MSRTHYQRIELGLVAPSPEQARALEAILAVPVLHSDQLFTQNERRDLCGAPLFQVENMSRATWLHASKLYGTHGLAPEIWAQLCTFFHTDSALECSALARIPDFSSLRSR